jgi:hypothetical protein
MPFLVFFNSSDHHGYKRCFGTCPNPLVDQLICQYNVVGPVNITIRQQLINNGTCIIPIMTKSVHYRCVPSDLKTNSTEDLKWLERIARDVSERPYLSRFFNQILYSWSVVFGSIFCAFVLSILWFSVLMTAGHRVLHISLFCISFISCGITAYMIYSLLQVKCLKTALQRGSTGVAILDDNLFNETYLWIATGFFGTISLTILICIAIFRKKVNLAGRLVLETAKAILAIGIIPMFGAIQVMIIVFLTLYFVFLIGSVLVAAFPLYALLM